MPEPPSQVSSLQTRPANADVPTIEEAAGVLRISDRASCALARRWRTTFPRSSQCPSSESVPRDDEAPGQGTFPRSHQGLDGTPNGI